MPTPVHDPQPASLSSTFSLSSFSCSSASCSASKSSICWPSTNAVRTRLRCSRAASESMLKALRRSCGSSVSCCSSASAASPPGATSPSCSASGSALRRFLLLALPFFGAVPASGPWAASPPAFRGPSSAMPAGAMSSQGFAAASAAAAELLAFPDTLPRVFFAAAELLSEAAATLDPAGGTSCFATPRTVSGPETSHSRAPSSVSSI
mmetsp:Transcript_5909/g.15013  ORF Transcript_5909/g.15013 Transcript_5909/m.15013 type:complete len:208 (-) Transcript_5909:1799-2422(-)